MKINIGNKEFIFNKNSMNLEYNGKIITPNIRTYGDMKLLYNNNNNLNDQEPLYLMYRGIYLNDLDKNIFINNYLRYDVTIILPRIIGGEYNKTHGHYHPKNSLGKKYEEIYEVIYGNALFLQQNNEVSYYTNAKQGDKVIMNEGFGHVTINDSDDILVMANIVNDTFESEYNNYNKNNGANYIYTKTGFILNKNYHNHINIKQKQDFFVGIDMYNDFLNNTEKFNFLH